jgi:alpha-ribazole phosphatase
MSPHLFIRHPEVSAAQGVCYGRTDWALPDHVFEAAAHPLRAQLPNRLIVSSPAQRCAGLARALAGESFSLDARLLEMNFGAWEGLLWSSIARTALDAWAKDVTRFTPPEGESFNDVCARLAAFIHAHEQPCIVITHAGVIRAAHHVLGRLPMEQAAAIRVPYAQVISFD